MSDQRVYPRDSPPVSGEHSHSKLMANSYTPSPSPPVSGEHRRNTSQDSFTSSKMSYAGYGSGPNPGTYVVQVPKDQIFRVPPPENAHKYKLYTKGGKAKKGRGCKCCLCSILATIIILIVLVAITGAVLFLVYKPKAPTYSIQSVHVTGVNASRLATSNTISPLFNVTLRIQNDNTKLGIYYEQGSSVNIFHHGVDFCNGKLPAFHQPPNTVTVFSTELKGAGIVLSKPARDKLLTEQKNGKVPFEIDIKLPVKLKIGAVKTWTFSVEVSCDVAINALTPNAKVVSKDCKVSAKPW